MAERLSPDTLKADAKRRYKILTILHREAGKTHKFGSDEPGEIGLTPLLSCMSFRRENYPDELSLYPERIFEAPFSRDKVIAELATLVKEGLIAERALESESKRTYYKITAEGEAFFEKEISPYLPKFDSQEQVSAHERTLVSELVVDRSQAERVLARMQQAKNREPGK